MKTTKPKSSRSLVCLSLATNCQGKRKRVADAERRRGVRRRGLTSLRRRKSRKARRARMPEVGRNSLSVILRRVVCRSLVVRASLRMWRARTLRRLLSGVQGVLSCRWRSAWRSSTENACKEKVMHPIVHLASRNVSVTLCYPWKGTTLKISYVVRTLSFLRADICTEAQQLVYFLVDPVHRLPLFWFCSLQFASGALF